MGTRVRTPKKYTRGTFDRTRIENVLAGGSTRQLDAAFNWFRSKIRSRSYSSDDFWYRIWAGHDPLSEEAKIYLRWLLRGDIEDQGDDTD